MNKIKFIVAIWLLLIFPLANCQNTEPSSNRGHLGIFFKKYFDFRNIGRYNKHKVEGEKSSDKIIFPDEVNNYQLVFEDNFDSLNTTMWQKGQPWGRFHPGFLHQHYSDSSVQCSGGKLHLLNLYEPTTFKITRNNKDTNIIIPYSSGFVNTYHSKSFKYGFFSIRSKNPAGPATWPAFWLTGKLHWPPEIDIFEMYGRCDGKSIHEQTMSLHMGSIEEKTKIQITKSAQLEANTDTAFHIYSCLWLEDAVKFYTDGVLLKTITLNTWMQYYFSEEMYLILSNGVDHNYLNCINNRALPNSFEIDWIRVYQKK